MLLLGPGVIVALRTLGGPFFSSVGVDVADVWGMGGRVESLLVTFSRYSARSVMAAPSSRQASRAALFFSRIPSDSWKIT